MGNKKSLNSSANRSVTDPAAINPAGMTFDEFLKKVGYKKLSFPTFENWVAKLFDYNKNGKIDRGKEQRGYKKAIDKNKNAAEYLATYQHELAAAIAADNATVDNLMLLWQSGNAAAMDEAKELARRDAANKESAEDVPKNNKLLWLLGFIGFLFLLKK